MTGGSFNAQGEFYLRTWDGLYLYYNFSDDTRTIGDGQGLDFRPARVAPPVEEFLMSYLKDEMVYFDVGANNGYYYSLKVATRRRGCKVYAFEPDPRIFFHLTKNVTINHAEGVKAIQEALTNYTGVARMTALLGASNFLIPNGISSDQRSIGVTCTTLDAFVAQNDIARIDCIKVDIEGGEFDFLDGARESLRRFKPTMILELNSELLRRSRSSIEQVRSLLAELGYEVLQVKDSTDALAIPSDKMDLLTPHDYSWLQRTPPAKQV
jgi:FkbM family methyltransferase